MPTTKHSSAAERHFQPEHTHEAAAASHDKHAGFSSHEETNFAEEQQRAAREEKQHEQQEHEKKQHEQASKPEN
jgi:hypothetical protein